jgi:hypothetical protein
MDRLNKLVSERLKQQPAGPHPEADTLAAFAENALGRPERQQTLAHLAECSDCREILYLAQPDSVATQPSVVYRPKRVTHFALRWGAVAASLVIVAGGLFITRHELFPANRKTAQQATPASYDTLAEKKAPAELDSVRNAEAPAAQKQLVTKTRPPEKHMTAMPQANMSFDESGQVRVLNENESTRTASGAGSAPGTDANSLAAYDKRSKQRDESVSAASTINAVGGDVAQNRSDAKDMAAAPENAQVSRSAPAVQTQAEPMFRAGAAAKVGSHRDEQAFKQTGAFMKALAAPVASWEVASNGGVQRSLDSGKTWQSVSVGGKGAVFHAVFYSGTQVWVGGIAGALYHSADSGLTWAKVIPATNGQTLEADISHIEFSDPQTGAVSATNGEVWLTSDAGQTWRRKSASPAN